MHSKASSFNIINNSRDQLLATSSEWGRVQRVGLKKSSATSENAQVEEQYLRNY